MDWKLNIPVFLFGVWFVLPYAVKKIQIYHLRQQCRVGRLIALTYDDGPTSLPTGRLLDLLDEYNATATFFVLGYKLVSSRETISRMISTGHELGSHSFSHLNAWTSNPVSVLRDTAEGVCSLRKIYPCRLYRAPNGKITLATWVQVKLLGCKQSWWTINSGDTWPKVPEIAVILDHIRREGGGVLLLHDHDRLAQPEREAFVLELTRRVVEMSKTEGFRICTLGEVINS